LSWGALGKLLAVRVGGMPKGALPPFFMRWQFSVNQIVQARGEFAKSAFAAFQRAVSIPRLQFPQDRV